MGQRKGLLFQSGTGCPPTEVTLEQRRECTEESVHVGV